MITLGESEFSGLISLVQIFNEALPSLTITNINNKVLTGAQNALIHDWSGYEFGGCALRKLGSEVCQNAQCDQYDTGIITFIYIHIPYLIYFILMLQRF